MRKPLSFALVAGLPLAASAQNLDAGRAAQEEWLAANLANSNAMQADSTANIGGFTQLRFNINSRDDVPGGGEDTAQGFSNAVTRLIVNGSVDMFSYEVSGDFDADGGFSLVDAYVAHSYDSGWTVVAGQMKAPYLREELVSATGLLAAGRSVTNSVFTAARVQGIAGLKTTQDFRWWVAVSDGIRTRNTDFDSDAEADYGLTTRFEYKWLGDDWSVFDDVTSFRGSNTSGMGGVAVHYQSGGESYATTGGATADVEILGITGDVSYEGNGWNAFGEFVYMSVEPAGGASTDDMGFVVQGGYFMNDAWEVFGRYDSIIADAADDFSTITVGVNKYFIPNSQAAKFTADAQFFLDEQATSLAAQSTTNVLLDSAPDSQWGLRLQLQLVF